MAEVPGIVFSDLCEVCPDGRAQFCQTILRKIGLLASMEWPDELTEERDHLTTKLQRRLEAFGATSCDGIWVVEDEEVGQVNMCGMESVLIVASLPKKKEGIGPRRYQHVPGTRQAELMERAKVAIDPAS